MFLLLIKNTNMKSFIATLLVAVLVTKSYTIPISTSLNFTQNHTNHTNHTIQLNESNHTIQLNKTIQLSRFNNTTALILISSIGGCKGTLFGCCLDGNTSASSHIDRCKYL